jgi:hypothetical protein
MSGCAVEGLTDSRCEEGGPPPPYGWQAHKKDLTEEDVEQAGRAGAR